MVHALYWVTALTYAIVLLIILSHAYYCRDEFSPVDKAYRRLLSWCVFFCLQDAVWGLTASFWKGDTPLFVSSSLFHLSTVVTANFWLYFVLTYLKNEIRWPKFYRFLGIGIAAFQLALVVSNFFTPTVFTVSDGQYVTEKYRNIAFLNQYLFYAIVCVITALAFIRAKGDIRKKYLAVFMFVLAPTLMGVFQLLYPDAPFYSVGTFIGCSIIHVFIVSKEHNDRLMIASTIDSLTNVYNRNVYEEDYLRFVNASVPDNLEFFSIDINGLKEVNDSQGHEAGDELIRGAASCIQKAFAGSGRIYRVGGDEFVVVISSDVEGSYYKNRLVDETLNWKGNKVKEISLSIGYVEKRAMPKADLVEIKNAADQMMYRDKEMFYMTKGVDRRGRQDAYNAICKSYTKILKINLSDDTFNIIQMNLDEKNQQMGFSDSISTWLHNFGTSGQVHPDDLKTYLDNTGLEFLRSHFASGKKSLEIFYRRKSENGFRSVMMEMLRSDDYAESNQNLFLFVKDVETKAVDRPNC